MLGLAHGVRKHGVGPLGALVGQLAGALDAGHDINRVLTTHDLVRGDNCFFVATGVTDGELLRGVRYRPGGAQTQSIVMRGKSGTIRLVESWHSLTKLRAYSAIDFEHGGGLPRG